MTPAEKDAAVLRVLHALPWRINAAAIKREMSYVGQYMSRDSLRRALVRIGAVRHDDGRYSAPPDPQATRPLAVPAFVCACCDRRVTYFGGSHVKGSQRVCWTCVERP